jgi:anti-sigma factor RsiW
MTHLIEEQLILYYYGEAGNDEAVDAHLAACASCRTNYQELQRVLAAVDTLPVPELPADYGQRVWRRIEPGLASGWRARWRLFPSIPRWATAGAMAALLLAAFLVGRFWPGGEPATVEQLSVDRVRERILLSSVADHLERSQRVLVEILNRSGEVGIDISADQSQAQDLLDANRIYRLSAAAAGEPAVSEVLDELERILLEIAHGSSRLSAAELGVIRDRIESQGILFKIRVIGSRMRERQNAEARELARRSS